ncbi:MAG: NAD(P)H-dependent oxidoreductase [Bacteroidales bacterium]|nr:NAD(P)H-dependent oxidoreductase [Bacteroidales bacterium]
MKILVVKYLPGREYSNTAILYNHFLKKVEGNHQIEEIDLEQNPPPFFDHKTLMAYYRRNYQGKELSSDQKNAIGVMDKLIDKVEWADIVLITSPMHNFGMPGVVKLWFDAIIQKGRTFDYTSEGIPYGKLKGKKALVLFTSGGEYSCHQVTLNYPEWDTYSFHVKIMLTFLGFDNAEVVTAATANPHSKEKNLLIAKNRIDEIIKNWNLVNAAESIHKI